MSFIVANLLCQAVCYKYANERQAMSEQNQIFLSYSLEDKAMMLRVHDTFQSNGLGVWTGEGIVRNTLKWQDTSEAIIRDVECIIVLFSPRSANSKWVRRALDFAEEVNKPIYPLLIRGNDSNAVPSGYAAYEWIDIRDEEKFLDGLSTLVSELSDLPKEAITIAPPIETDSELESIEYLPNKSPSNVRGEAIGTLILLTIIIIFGMVWAIAGNTSIDGDTSSEIDAIVETVEPTLEATIEANTNDQ